MQNITVVAVFSPKNYTVDSILLLIFNNFEEKTVLNPMSSFVLEANIPT